jgi:hypothetical protein
MRSPFASARRFLCAPAVALLLACGSLASAGCADKPTEDECKGFLAHVIELEVTPTGGEKLTDEEQKSLDKQKKAVSDYLRKQFVDKCKKETPGAFIRCGLKAKTKDELAQCDKS